MIACVDVQYHENRAAAALLCFADWTSKSADIEHAVHISNVEEYIPGQFYKRELPCILEALKAVPNIDILLIDGYVWLGLDETGQRKKGLGAYLFEALNQQVAIIGVAKTKFKSSNATEVYRAASKQALYVTAAGYDEKLAAASVQQMYGAHRLPAMLKQVDQLARRTIK